MARLSLALAFATIERPQVAQRLIRSVRRYFPDMPIYVADQSRQADAAVSFYQENGVTFIRMPFDCGVTASRNRLALAVREDCFVLCDDDFVLGPETDFRDALRILASCPEIGVVGGKLFDFGWGEESVRHWELYLQYDKRQKILVSIPIQELAPKARDLGGIRYYLCDAVLNFAVFRRAMFDNGVRWDERFKSNGEHEDFYLNLKQNFSHLVAYLPTMTAYHHHPAEYRAYISQLRERSEGWKKFFEKWGLEQHVEFGLGVRTLDDLSRVVSAQEARARFFVNADLSLRRAESDGEMLLIGDFVKIAPVGVLDAAGSTTGNGNGTAALLLDPATRALVPAGDRSDAAAAPRDTPAERYRLETSEASPAVSSTNREIHFRYDAVLRPDADFYLWYYCDGPQPARSSPPPRLAATLRWTAGADTVLVWKSRRIFLDLGSVGYWRPLRLDLPLLPRGAAWLRFDLLSDGGSSRDPVATGFLFAAGKPGGGLAEAPALEVLGFSRLPNDGAGAGAAGRDIDEIGRTCPVRAIAAAARALLPQTRLVETGEMAGIEALYFVGWESFGRQLVGTRLPRSGVDAPRALCLPRSQGGSSEGRIYGYGAGPGLERLVLAPDEAQSA